MAKAKKQVSFEDALWGACDKLRGTVEPAEYKHAVLSLIFLKFVSDKFDPRRARVRRCAPTRRIPRRFRTRSRRLDRR